MKTNRAGLGVALVILWAVLPWPLARWAALFGALFLGFSALWAFLLSRSLRAEADDPLLRSFAGRRVEVRTRIENRSPLPSGLLFVSDSSGGLETWGETRRYLRVPGVTRVNLAFTVRGRERGDRVLGPLRISGSDPAGLFPFVRQAPNRTLVVYPPVRPVRGWPRDGIPSGPRKWEPALVDDVSRFRSYRDFQTGDPLARVSAAAWAHRGTPQVRTYDRTVARPTGVVVDLRAGRYPLKLRWAQVEAAVETAASLVWDLLGRGESVWLTVIDRTGGTETLGPGRGWAQARPFLERLALAVSDKAEETPFWPPALVLPPAPLRLLWVGPRTDRDTPMPVRGYEVLWFPIGEEETHGAVVHP